MQPAIQQAISSMRERYYEPITLRDLAAEVFVSPFHFSRVFAKATGITPGRYLTAIRLFEAKRLLLTTSLTVADIVCTVGYSSVGTFTTRFTRAVGMTPSQYRAPEVRDLLVAVAPDFCRVPSLEALRRAGKHCVPGPQDGTASLTGSIELPPEAAPANILVGIFADRVPQSGPVAYKYLREVGSSRLDIHDIPAGRWNVVAVAERAGVEATGESILIGSLPQPVSIAPGRTGRLRLRMRELRPTDPPMAITLASPMSIEPDLGGATQLRALPAVA